MIQYSDLKAFTPSSPFHSPVHLSRYLSFCTSHHFNPWAGYIALDVGKGVDLLAFTIHLKRVVILVNSISFSHILLSLNLTSLPSTSHPLETHSSLSISYISQLLVKLYLIHQTSNSSNTAQKTHSASTMSSETTPVEACAGMMADRTEYCCSW